MQSISRRLLSTDARDEIRLFLAKYKGIPPGNTTNPAKLHQVNSRSSGPGGQNVNKLNSKVDMRMDVDWLPAIIGMRLRDAEKHKFNKLEQLTTSSDKFRTQIQNKQECIGKLDGMVRAACQMPQETSPQTLARIERLY